MRYNVNTYKKIDMERRYFNPYKIEKSESKNDDVRS